MPPKRRPDQLPAACEELRAALVKEGGDVTAAGIAGVERGLRQRAFSALNSALKASNAEKYVEFAKLKFDEEKRQWLSAFLIDPKSGGSLMTNTVERSVASIERGSWAWMTVEEFGGPRGCNSMEHARKRCEGKEFLERPHESPILADEGVKQYYCPLNHEDAFTKTKTESVALETKTDLPEDSVDDIRAMMENHGSITVPTLPNTKRRRKDISPSGSGATPSKADAEEHTDLSPEDKAKLELEKQLAEAQSRLKDVVKKAKVQCDKVNKELGEVGAIEDRIAS
eukprot:5470175-Pyramimonas_sp.AAC.1